MPLEISLYITSYGYVAIFILIFLQEIGVPNPLPNELVLMFSGYLVYNGNLHFIGVILAAISADFIGTNILYIVFYFFGLYILKHKPRWVPVSDATIARISEKFSDGNNRNIYLGRLTPFLRGYTSVTAGLLQIKPVTFLPIALISALTWSVFYVTVGIIISPYWSQLVSNTRNFSYLLIAILVIILIIVIIRQIINHRQNGNKNSVSKSEDETVQLINEVNDEDL